MKHLQKGNRVVGKKKPYELFRRGEILNPPFMGFLSLDGIKTVLSLFLNVLLTYIGNSFLHCLDNLLTILCPFSNCSIYSDILGVVCLQEK